MIDWKKYTALVSDSRKVVPGSAFFCVPKGEAAERYIAEAKARGAADIFRSSELGDDGIRRLMSEAAGAFYDRLPAHIAAVTGTNGKTSTVAFAGQMLELLGKKAGTVGTLGVWRSGGSGYEEIDNTTPGAFELGGYLADFAKAGIDYAAFEASSHALDQHRADFVSLQAAGFTNLTQDHLDYHKDMPTYLAAKKRLFFELLAADGVAVLNADAASFGELAKCGRKVVSYGRKGADIRLESVVLEEGGAQRVRAVLFGKPVEAALPVSGDFQVYNALCAVGLLVGLGFDAEAAFGLLPKLAAPAGRMDFVAAHNGALVYVDYAHTPDALEKAIRSLRPYVKPGGKLKVLFGCGGDRDKGKRPIMGRIASELADFAYVTDDNPRTEEASVIRGEVLAGAGASGKANAADAGDRASALALAVSELAPGDVLLAAGKGHEDYQIVGSTKVHFDDKGVIRGIVSVIRVRGS